MPAIPAAPRRILIIKPSSLGDIAATLPLLCDLQALYPAGRIDWLIHPALADLVRNHDALDELIFFDRAALARWWINPRATGELWSLIGALRRRRYEMVIDAQGLLRSALLGQLSGAPIRIGFADAREGATRLYTHRVPIAREKEPAVMRMRALLNPVGPPGGPARFRLPIQPAALRAIQSRLPSDRPPAAIIPGARWHAKRWSERGYRQITRLLAATGVAVAILGSRDERSLGQEVADRIDGAMNLAGQTTLAEMVALLSLCRIVIGNDSGPLHVAAALERPLVGLYGPTDPVSVGPYGQMDHVLRFDETGDFRAAAADRSKTLAMLPVERVWRMVEKVLQE